MQKIKQLPLSEIQKIAAGQVVERPSNVVKELVENSLDAGSTKISVYIEAGGERLIRVVDNGTGMSEVDAALSFERHATSKITNFEQLQTLATFGFRGEALYSIGAVSTVTLLTKEIDAPHGIQICFKEGNIVKKDAVSCAQGTDISVVDLFANVPARKMFAKLSVYKDLYALLYDQIRKEQVVYGRLLPKEKRLEFLDRNKISFLTYGPAQTLPEHLFIKTKKIAKKDQDDSFLPVMQQGMQKNQRKKEKAKTHKRPHKKPQAQYSEDSSQRILKQPIIKMQRLNCAMAHLPEYDSRVLRWVDQEWVARENPNKQSLLYHTCGFPYLDHFLYSWGKKEDQPNRKKPQILDTIYKMGGEIFFPSGLKKTVLFHFVLYARGKTQKVSKCYHRGFDDREKVHCSDFFQFKIQEDEDDQEVEPSYDVKKLEILNKVSNVDEIEFEENQFNIKFYDEYNKVGIVLFKQLQKQLTY
jgi:DNA mismatch repair protein MutL